MTVLETLSSRRTRLSAWLAERTPREQALLGAASLLAIAFLLVTLVWKPLSASRAAALADIRTYEAVSAQIKAGGPRLAQRASLARTPSGTLITQTAAQAGLTLRRLEPEGAQTVVTLEDVEFDKVMAWLERLQREGGLGVAALKLDRRPAPGIVNVQLTLSGG